MLPLVVTHEGGAAFMADAVSRVSDSAVGLSPRGYYGRLRCFQLSRLLDHRPVGGVPGSLLPVHPQVRAFLAQHGSAILAGISKPVLYASYPPCFMTRDCWSDNAYSPVRRVIEQPASGCLWADMSS